MCQPMLPQPTKGDSWRKKVVFFLLKVRWFTLDRTRVEQSRFTWLNYDSTRGVYGGPWHCPNLESDPEGQLYCLSWLNIVNDLLSLIDKWLVVNRYTGRWKIHQYPKLLKRKGD